MSSENTEDQIAQIQSILGRLNELKTKTELGESELNEITSAPEKIAEFLKLIKQSSHPFSSALTSSLKAWNENHRDKKIESAVEGLRSLKSGNISDDQLDDLIDLDETVTLYLETRMYGSNIFTSGLVMELNSLKKFRKSRKTSPEPDHHNTAQVVTGQTSEA